MEQIELEGDRHLDALLAQYCLGYRWYVAPMTGMHRLKDPEMTNGAWTPLDTDLEKVSAEWDSLPDVPRFSAAPHLIYSLLLEEMRGKGLYCMMRDRIFESGPGNPYWAGFQRLGYCPAFGQPLPFSASSDRSLTDAISRAALAAFNVEAYWA